VSICQTVRIQQTIVRNQDLFALYDPSMLHNGIDYVRDAIPRKWSNLC